MVDLDVRPRVAVVRSLLQIERVEFVRLRRRAGHQPIEHGRIAIDAGAACACVRVFVCNKWKVRIGGKCEDTAWEV